MSRYITWLHISDLHFCAPSTGWQSDRILLKLREDLRRLDEEDGLRPDFVFVTGDVAFGHRGDAPGYNLADQYEEAARFFRDVLGTYSPALPLERLFIVPGNHDVHRKMIPESTTSWLAAQDLQRVLKMIQERDLEWRTIMPRLEAYRDFLSLKLGATHLLTHPEHLIYSRLHELHGVKVGIAGLNSAWSCGRDKEKGSLWLAGEWQINTLEQELMSADVRIALMHHPPNWFGESEDPSVGHRLESAFHFFLHGHEHLGWISAGENHVRIAAGAAYGSSDAESGYNFVRLDLDTGTALVWLRHYTKEGMGGWVPYPIPGLTNSSGRKTLAGLSFLQPLRPPPPPVLPAPPPPAAVEPEPPLEGAAAHGVYGRDGAIREVSNLLTRHAVVVVYGLSGIGKTTLIREVMSTPAFRSMLPWRLSADSRWKMADLYGQVARLFGNRDEHLEPPPLVLGKRDWSSLRRGSQPTVILIEHAHLLFDEHGKFRDPDIGALLLAISEYAPKVRVVLECRTKVSTEILGPEGSNRLATHRLRGLDSAAMAQFFRRPYPDRADVGWVLGTDEAGKIAERLGSERHGGVHPLAMELLAALAEGVAQTPLQVLDRHAHVLRNQLEEALFRDLFDNALSNGERQVLGLCALYRDEIPSVIHAIALNASAEDDQAFQGLESRCLLTGAQGNYFLHSLVRDLVLSRMTGKEQGHATIADAWLQTVKQTPTRSPERFRAASEAAYHLLQAEQYQRLNELKSMLQRRGDLLTELEEKSKHLHRLGRHSENRVVLELLVALDPGNHKARSFLGDCLEKLHGRGNHAALEHYEEAQRLDPTYPRYLSILGRALLARNELTRFLAILEALPEDYRKQAVNDHVASQWSKALSRLHRNAEASKLRMLRINSGSRNPALYSSEARWLHHQGKSEEALAMLGQAERRGISNDYTDSTKAHILETLGREAEASALRTGRINSGSRNPALYVSEARWLHHQGKSEEALALLALAVQRGISNEYTLTLELSILEAQGRVEQLSVLRQSRIEAGDRNPLLYVEEARWLHGQGQSEDALALLAQAERRGIISNFILTLETSILESLGRGEDASALRQRRIEAGNRTPILYVTQARWLHSQGKSEEALALLTRAEKDGIIKEYTMTRASILEALGRGEEASALRRGRLAAGERTPSLYTQEARWLHGQGRSEEALALLVEAEKHVATREHAIHLRIRLMEELGRWEEASALRQAQIKAGERKPHFYIDEAQWLHRQGRSEEALALLVDAEKNVAGREQAMLLRLRFLEELGRGEEASALRQGRIEAGERNVNFHLSEASWLHKEGRSEQALALLVQAEQRGVDSDSFILLRSKLLEELGRLEEASALRLARIEAGSRDPGLYLREAQWLSGQGKLEQALAVLEQAEERYIRKDSITSLKLRLLEELGHGERVSAARWARINAGSKYTSFFGDEARWLYREGRVEEAFALLLLAEQRGVSGDYVAYVRASLLEKIGRGEEASALRRARIDAGSRNLGLVISEASWLHLQGRSEEALATLVQIEQHGVSSGYITALKARLLDESGRSADAAALRAHPAHHEAPPSALELGESGWLPGQGESDEAFAFLDQQDDTAASSPDVLENKLLEELDEEEHE